MQRGAIYYKDRVFSGNADITRNVLGNLATIEQSSIASRLYNVGTYFVYNFYLYVVTSTIAPGATIIPGTNCERTTVEQELAKISSINDAYGTPDEFSTSASYAIGDFCIYNNAIYCCKSEVTAGSEFNSSQWQATTIWELTQDKTVDFGTISSLPQTFSVDGITPAHDVVRSEMGNPSAFTGDLTVNTNAIGFVTLSGTINGSSTLKIKFSPSKQEVAQAVTS